jgi:acetyl-CoA acetyltransferase
MSVYVIGLATHPAKAREDTLRLEEMAFHTSRAALDSAGVTRRQLDSITLGACDELDGRPISSMLMTAPAGGYGTDEIKVTDSGASALCLAYARFLAGESQLGLVVSWCKSSKTDVDAVMRLRGEPFYTRPLSINATISDALFAQAVSDQFAVTETEVADRVVNAYRRAAQNERGMRHPVPTPESVIRSPFDAVPLRRAHRAPLTDGAVALILASDDFLNANQACKPLARIAGAGWATDSYRLERERLRAMNSARAAWNSALRQAGLKTAAELDTIELDSQTAFHEAAYVRVFGIEDADAISPSGSTFAQNPLFCTGLVNAAAAVLQVGGKAGGVQRPAARWAAAHSCHGYAQQGNVVVVFEGNGGQA